MATSGSDLDEARRLVVERGLARAAFEHLTMDAFLTLPFEALGPTKTLLKRFFSPEGWGPADDDALAAAVGPGEGRWRRDLDADVALDYGWVDGRFRVRVETAAAAPAPAVEAAVVVATDPLAGTFDGPVVPEATPNPRSIRFQVGPIHRGPSRWYESAAAAADDPRLRPSLRRVRGGGQRPRRPRLRGRGPAPGGRLGTAPPPRPRRGHRRVRRSRRPARHLRRRG